MLNSRRSLIFHYLQAVLGHIAVPFSERPEEKKRWEEPAAAAQEEPGQPSTEEDKAEEEAGEPADQAALAALSDAISEAEAAQKTYGSFSQEKARACCPA